MTLTDQIIGSLRQEPERWVEGVHRLVNGHKKVELWTANGWFHIEVVVSPKGRIRLSLASRWRIWREVKRWRRLPL